MKKYLAFMLLTALPLLGANDFGFFYVQDAQTIEGPTAGGVYSGVVWNLSQDDTTGNISINPSDLDSIIIQDKGAYVAHFTILGTPTTVGQTTYRFALELNGTIIPGSVFAVTANADDPIEELVGEIIFRTTVTNSVLRLVNDSADDSDVILSNIAGHGGATNNTTASLSIINLRKGIN